MNFETIYMKDLLHAKIYPKPSPIHCFVKRICLRANVSNWG